MYNLLGTETIINTIPNEELSMTFAMKDMGYILQEMGITAPMTMLYIMQGTEYEANNFKEVAEALSGQVVVAVVGPPKEFTIEETNVFLDTVMKEFCENEFIPINNMVGQYEKRETFIYGNAIGELVAAFILRHRMGIIEFAENCLKLELTEYQKEFLRAYYNCGPDTVFISTPVRSGKTLIAKIITEYEKGTHIN